MKSRMQYFLVFNILLLTLFGCGSLKKETYYSDASVHRILVNSVADAEDFYRWTEDRIPLISAHRGGRFQEGYAENSIPMFEYTISHNPAIIEFDVRRSKDGHFVLMHDATTKRTTTADFPISELTLNEIKKLTLIDYNGNRAYGQIPTLEEVLNWGRGKVLFTVDVKDVDDINEIAQIIIEHNAEPYAAIITYSLEVAERVYKAFPTLFLSVTVRNSQELQRLLNTEINLSHVVAFTELQPRMRIFIN